MNSFDLRRELLVTCLLIVGLFPLGSAAAEQQTATTEVAKVQGSRGSLGRWELRAAPLQLAYRFYSVEFAYRISKQWSMGPSVVVYDSPGNLGGMFGPTYHGAAFGLNSTYYFKSVASHTPYISSHVFYQSYTSYGHASRGYAENVGGRGDAVIGYQWRWNLLSLRVGGGLQLESEEFRTVTPANLASDPDTIESSRRTDLFPTVELKVGIEI